MTLLRDAVSQLSTASIDPVKKLRSLLSKQQLAFVDDPSRFKVARCGRRSGKTYMLSADAIITCITEPGVPILYAGLTRDSAKKAIWDILLMMCHEAGIVCDPKASELTIYFPNRSYITLFGCDTQNARNRLRGRKFRKIYFDETGFYSALDPLIHAVLPTLSDYGGDLYLTSSPGILLSGFFYDVDQGDKKEKWSRYHWTLHDNPLYQQPSQDSKYATRADEELDIICDLEFGGNRNSPAFRREYLGAWIGDTTTLVYPVRDFIDVAYTMRRQKHIIGIDLGSNIASALVVGRYSEFARDVQFIANIETTDWTIDRYARAVAAYIQRYQPESVVAHLGDQSKEVVTELRRRYRLPIRPIELEDKAFHQRIFSTDLQAGYIKVRKNLPLVKQFSKIVKDSNGNEIDGQQNWSANAALVAYKSVYQTYLSTYEPPLSEEEQILATLEDRTEESYEWWERV